MPRRKRRTKRRSIEAPRRGDLVGYFSQFHIELRRRLAKNRDRDRQIRSEVEAAYPLIEEHKRLAVRRDMDRQLCGDPC